MAVSWPVKTNWNTGDVLLAADLDNLALGVEQLDPTSATDGQVLTRDNATAGKIKWATPASTSAVNQNALLNADFLINQRNFTSNTTTGTYNFDRWLQTNSGGTCTVTPQTFTPGAAPLSGVEGRTFVQMITAGQSIAGDYAYLTQRIEDVTRFAGQSVTISFYAKANTGTPSIGVEVNQNFGSGGAPSASVSTPVGAKVLSTSWARYTATVTVPSISGKTLGTTANTSYLELNLWISSGATNATRASSIGIQNATFSIWGVKVEAGSTASAFSTNTGSLQGELAACQRYYYRQTAASGQNIFGTGVNSTTSACDTTMRYPSIMRAAPTLETDGTAAHYGVLAGGSGSNCNAVPSIIFAAETSAIGVRFGMAASLTAGNASIGYISAIGAYLGFNAEL